MHNHSKNVSRCDHKLKYCTVCDTVYCKSCEREWARKDFFPISEPISDTVTYPPPLAIVAVGYKDDDGVNHLLPNLEMPVIE